MKKWLINAKRLIKETFKWFIKGWFIYLPIILFVFTFFLESEKAIARYGTALQIIAAITIGAGLSSRFILFEGKSLLQIPKEYFSKFPLTRKRENVVIGFKGDELKTKEGEIKIVAYLNEQSFKDIPEVVKYFHEHIQALHTSIKNERKGLESE